MYTHFGNFIKNRHIYKKQAFFNEFRKFLQKNRHIKKRFLGKLFTKKGTKKAQLQKKDTIPKKAQGCILRKNIWVLSDTAFDGMFLLT